jgi:hypothetical protein
MEKRKTETRCAEGVRLYYRYVAALAIHSERVSQKMEAETLEERRRVRCTLSDASKNLASARREYFRHVELHRCELGNRPSGKTFVDGTREGFDSVSDEDFPEGSVSKAQDWSVATLCPV